MDRLFWRASLVLFQSTQNGTDVRNTWGPLAADGFELHEVPGDHFTLFEEPHRHVCLPCTLDSVSAAGPGVSA